MAALPNTTVPVELGPIWRISVERYHEMLQQGLLTADDRVELLAGVLVEKMSKNPPHRVATGRARRALEAIVPAGWYVEMQEPVTLSGSSEPEPDVAVIRGAFDDYRDRHPGASEVALVIEVADSTLPRDRVVKKQIYASAGIPLYWIINLIDHTLEVFSQPLNGDYVESQTLHDGEQAVTPWGNLEVSRLLP